MEKTEKKAWSLNEEAVQAVLQDISFGNQIRPTAKKYGKSTFCSSIKPAAFLSIIDALIKIKKLWEMHVPWKY